MEKRNVISTCQRYKNKFSHTQFSSVLLHSTKQARLKYSTVVTMQSNLTTSEKSESIFMYVITLGVGTFEKIAGGKEIFRLIITRLTNG